MVTTAVYSQCSSWSPCQPGIISKMAAKASSAVTRVQSTVHANSSIGLTRVIQSSQHFLSSILTYTRRLKELKNKK